ncbi:MAG: hypothetical protein H7144_01155 [Burkholderiales bacterium]|nr:hypothetical protein [Phycisphaerae bacterium]
MSQTPPPMRVLPVTLAYGHAATSGAPARPSVVGVVGVISIILAAAALATNLGTAIFSGVIFVTAAQQTNMIAMNKMPAVQLVAPDEAPSADGVNDTVASNIIDGLRSARPMTTRQASHVRQLATKSGRKLFPFGTPAITAARVRDNVSASGEVLIGPDKTANYYVLGLGRLDVSDTQAVFRSDDNAVYRSGDVAVNRSLAEPVIEAHIANLNAQLAPPLNDAQQAALRTLLRDPNQIAFPQDDNRQFMPAGNFENGGVWIYTTQAQVRLARDGTPTLLSPLTPTPGVNPFSGKKITTAWGRALLGESVVGGLMGVLLLVAAIFLLRGRPAGRKLLIIYSLIKLPLAILGAWILARAIDELTNAVGPGAIQSAFGPGLTGAIAAAASGIWPIIVLVTMCRRSVRDYFKGVI